MIKEDELLEAIAECQGQRNPDANTCIKLASYYTILNELRGAEKVKEEPINNEYSFASEPEYVGYISDTEFGQIVQNMDINEVLMIMDELMSTIQVLVPKLYDGVMRKLNN